VSSNRTNVICKKSYSLKFQGLQLPTIYFLKNDFKLLLISGCNYIKSRARGTWSVRTTIVVVQCKNQYHNA